MFSSQKQYWRIALILALLCHAVFLLIKFQKIIPESEQIISIQLNSVQPTIVEQKATPEEQETEFKKEKEVAVEDQKVETKKPQLEQVLTKTVVPKQNQTVIISAKAISDFADQESKRDSLSHQQQEKAFSDSFKDPLVINNNQPITELKDSSGETHVRAEIAGKPVCYRTNNAMVKDEWDVDAVLFYECSEKKQEFKLRR